MRTEQHVSFHVQKQRQAAMMMGVMKKDMHNAGIQ
jgi:type II secretory pathway component PulJ